MRVQCRRRKLYLTASAANISTLTKSTPAPGRLQATRKRRLHWNIPLCLGERYLILVEKPFTPIEIAVDQHKAAAGGQAKRLDDRSDMANKLRNGPLSLMDADAIAAGEVALRCW
jgi:hypothetical protein